MRPFLAAALLAPLAAAADLPVPSRVEGVVVYASSARVTRVARVDLPAGEVRLALPGATDLLLDDSLRVRGAGTARALVQGVSVERVTGAGASSPEARAAQERLERLLDEDRTLEDRQRAAGARRDFVESLRSTYSEERTRNMAVRSASAREWSEMVSFVARERERAAAEGRAAEVARRELSRRLQAARAELERLRGKLSETTKTLAVDLRAERAGSVELEVSYLVPRASWRPVWDAHLRPEAQAVDLSLFGSVEQSTGEDWSEVKLVLSTAQPSRSLAVPELRPRYLDRPRPVAPVPAAKAERRAAREAAAAAAPEASGGDAREAIEEAPAEIAQGLLSATFAAPRRASVDGAGRARRVHLAAFSLGAELTRLAAPRQDPTAYLTARAAHGAGPVLLPGPVSVFVGEEFVGRATLPLTPPGGELKLAFGADDRVRIERQVVERRHETAGLFSRQDVHRFRSRTTVKNLYPTPVTVRLLDLVPVSRDEEVEVEVLEVATAPSDPQDPMRPGVRGYLLTLKPGEESAVEIAYRVRCPKGMAVQGLE
jgi:uncharacterized protein (TIGR02231 family)